MTWLDRALDVVAPGLAASRAEARCRAQAYRQALALYEGTAPGRRGRGWRRPSTDANAEIGRGLVALRDGARDLVRNNPYARRGVEVIAGQVVGAGIIATAQAIDATARERAQEALREHLESKQIDADGLHDIHGLFLLIVRTLVESGECILRRRRRRASDGLSLPFQVQVLEPDYLDHTRNGPADNGNLIIQGVEFDRIGRRVAYWLHDEHPGARGHRATFVSRRVPASEVAHVYRVDRPGQVRGVPWLAPVMLRLRDFADLQDAQLMRQKIAACFAAFVHDADPAGGVNPLGVKSEQNTAGDPVDKLSPGMVKHLPPGKTISFGQPPTVEGYGDLASIELHAIAVGLGISYEALTGDLRQVNFSSGRMGKLDEYRTITTTQMHVLRPGALQPIARWFADGLRASGRVMAPVSLKWTWPKRDMLDPTKEVPANRDAVRSGQITPFDLVRQYGKDPREHFAEMAEAFDMLDDMGVVLDSDPRKVARSGTAQSSDAVFARETEAASEESE